MGSGFRLQGFRGVRGGGLGFRSLEQPCGCEVPSPYTLKRCSGFWSKGTEGVISKPDVLMLFSYKYLLAVSSTFQLLGSL